MSNTLRGRKREAIGGGHEWENDVYGEEVEELMEEGEQMMSMAAKAKPLKIVESRVCSSFMLIYCSFHYNLLNVLVAAAHYFCIFLTTKINFYNFR